MCCVYFSGSKWNHIDNLDEFFERVSDFFTNHGFNGGISLTVQTLTLTGESLLQFTIIVASSTLCTPLKLCGQNCTIPIPVACGLWH